MIKFAILTAVSTPNQARPGTVSLKHQQEKSRQAALSQGWLESAGPFVIDGYSRTAYVDLTLAEQDIPPLHAALEAGRAGAYDVLVIYTYDRLGDLTALISRELRKYRRQVYSVTQPSVVQDPQDYDPYANESADIQEDAARIVQRFRINDLRRKLRAAMPGRLEKGLTPLRVPFGYRWAGKKEPPVLDEQQAALIYQMRDWLFAGISMTGIAQRCDASRVSPPNGGPRWDITTIRYILANPYYTGQTAIYKTRYIHDPNRKGQHRPIPQPLSKWQTGQGAHRPLWDETTHRAILRELDRRRESNLRVSVRFPLSGLLTCSVCGQKLHRRSHGIPGGRRKVLACRNGQAHIIIPYDQAVSQVARELFEKLKDQQANPTPPQDPGENIRTTIEGLAARRKRIQSGHEAGVYSDAEASQKIAEIETTAETLRAQLETARRDAEIAAEFKAVITGKDLDRLPEWILTDDPATVNRTISALCKKIDLTPQGQVLITFR